MHTELSSGDIKKAQVHQAMAAYLGVLRGEVAQDEHRVGYGYASEQVKAAPPALGRLDAFIQDISHVLG